MTDQTNGASHPWRHVLRFSVREPLAFTQGCTMTNPIERINTKACGVAFTSAVSAFLCLALSGCPNRPATSSIPSPAKAKQALIKWLEDGDYCKELSTMLHSEGVLAEVLHDLGSSETLTKLIRAKIEMGQESCAIGIPSDDDPVVHNPNLTYDPGWYVSFRDLKFQRRVRSFRGHVPQMIEGHFEQGPSGEWRAIPDLVWPLGR